MTIRITRRQTIAEIDLFSFLFRDINRGLVRYASMKAETIGIM